MTIAYAICYMPCKQGPKAARLRASPVSNQHFASTDLTVNLPVSFADDVHANSSLFVNISISV